MEEIGEVLSDLEIAEIAIGENVCYTRDPNDAAMLLCYGKKLVRVKIYKRARFGNRSPRRVVMFGFLGHDDVYRAAIRAKLTYRSTKDYQDVCFGEHQKYLSQIKTLIHSYL